jgi:hypothetical protein
MGAAFAALVLSLFLDWFETDDVKTSGWSGLALGVAILIVIALICCAALLFLVQSGAPLGPTMFITVVTVVITIATLIAVTINVLTTDADLLWPAIAGIAFTAMVALGAWRSMGDERLDAPESAYTPPEARPIPK